MLASASPRRLQLLERVGLTPDLLNPADVDELPHKRETPRALSIRLAREKAQRALEMPLVKELGPNAFVLAADTVVGLGRRILPKAETVEEASALVEKSGAVTTTDASRPSASAETRVIDASMCSLPDILQPC